MAVRAWIFEFFRECGQPLLLQCPPPADAFFRKIVKPAQTARFQIIEGEVDTALHKLIFSQSRNDGRVWINQQGKHLRMFGIIPLLQVDCIQPRLRIVISGMNDPLQLLCALLKTGAHVHFRKPLERQCEKPVQNAVRFPAGRRPLIP